MGKSRSSNLVNIMVGDMTYVFLPVSDAIIVTLENIRRRMEVNMMGALVAR